jgi:hypothetical protein
LLSTGTLRTRSPSCGFRGKLLKLMIFPEDACPKGFSPRASTTEPPAPVLGETAPGLFIIAPSSMPARRDRSRPGGGALLNGLSSEFELELESAADCHCVVENCRRDVLKASDALLISGRPRPMAEWTARRCMFGVGCVEFRLQVLLLEELTILEFKNSRLHKAFY